MTPAHNTTDRGFVGAARVVAGVTLLSRVFGLARDAICSRVFGAGAVWSAFAFAFLLPNLARRLFGEGALTGAFIPEYTRLLDEDRAAANRYASAMLGLTIAFLSALAIAGELVLLALLTLTPIGRTGDLAITLALVLLPFAPMICVTALIGGILQTHGRFAPTAAAPVILNACIIAGVVLWKLLSGADLEHAAYSAAGGILVAGALQIGWSLLAAREFTSWTRVRTGVRAPVVRTLKRTAPVIVGLGALQINTLLDGLIASWPVLVGATITLPFAGTLDYPLDEQSNAALFFASRLYQFPLGVFGIALATAVFPLLARQAKDPSAFDTTLRDGLRLSLFIGLPATLGLVLVRDDLTSVIYAGGLFDDASVRRVSFVLAAYAAGVWAYIANHTLTRAYYALGDTTTPMRVSLLMVGVNVALNLALIWRLGEAGLAVSTALCGAGQFLLLAAMWRRASGRPIGAGWFSPTALVLTMVMGGCVLGLQTALDALGVLAHGWGGSVVRLGGAIVVGTSVYLALAALLRRPELRLLLSRGAAKLG